MLPLGEPFSGCFLLPPSSCKIPTHGKFPLIHSVSCPPCCRSHTCFYPASSLLLHHVHSWKFRFLGQLISRNILECNGIDPNQDSVCRAEKEHLQPTVAFFPSSLEGASNLFPPHGPIYQLLVKLKHSLPAKDRPGETGGQGLLPCSFETPLHRLCLMDRARAITSSQSPYISKIGPRW